MHFVPETFLGWVVRLFLLRNASPPLSSSLLLNCWLSWTITACLSSVYTYLHWQHEFTCKSQDCTLCLPLSRRKQLITYDITDRRPCNAQIVYQIPTQGSSNSGVNFQVFSHTDRCEDERFFFYVQTIFDENLQTQSMNIIIMKSNRICSLWKE